MPVVFCADSQRVAHWMIRKYMLKPHHLRSDYNAVLRAAAATGSIHTLKWAKETLGFSKQEFMICGNPGQSIVCTSGSPLLLLWEHPLKSSDVESVVGVHVPKSLRTRPREEIDSFIMWLIERLPVTSQDLLAPLYTALDSTRTGTSLLYTAVERGNVSLVAALVDATGVTKDEILFRHLMTHACDIKGTEMLSFLIDKFALDEYYAASRKISETSSPTYEITCELESAVASSLLASNPEATRIIFQRFALSRSVRTDSSIYWIHASYRKGFLSVIKLLVEANILRAEEVEKHLFPLIRETKHTPQHDLIHAFLTDTFHLPLPLEVQAENP
ncbi:hypothetical protein Pelo_366 [Pelomyxa schiedti]|nr:hypothetical protein Pelo_366 [Pelomyxa schiedti]